MKNAVTQWYGQKKNVDEMPEWNLALKEWEKASPHPSLPARRSWISAAAWDGKRSRWRTWALA